jgi:putative spermidine/putrescine transport system ATP-binding protein/spermidine/putrescine transport system ATP-binding protein
MLSDPRPFIAAAAADAPPAVAIEGVGKSFDGVRALQPCDLKIRKGEFLTLLGPSGCGKTTLLNLIAGFIEADEGELFIDGALVTQTPPHKREIGIVFQSYALFPHMSVADNVAYGLRTRGVAREQVRARTAEALRLVKLQDFADRRPRQLSGGQQQRVALARALVIRPRVLLLDEPFSALDRNLRAAMQVELKEIQSALGVTTVFVTHDQGEALSMSDRIAVMSSGRIRQVGTPREIYAAPESRFVADFVGDANFFQAEVAGAQDGRTILTVGGARIAARGPAPAARHVQVFARPEACALTDPDAPGAIPARVALGIYQGAFQELHLDCEAGLSGRVLLRAPAAAPVEPGARVGIALDPEGVRLFADAED